METEWASFTNDPGPTNVDFSVLSMMAKPTISNLDPEFIKILRQTLKNVRKIFFSEDGHPFIVPGSGTLAMEMVSYPLPAFPKLTSQSLRIIHIHAVFKIVVYSLLHRDIYTAFENWVFFYSFVYLFSEVFVPGILRVILQFGIIIFIFLGCGKIPALGPVIFVWTCSL